MKKQPIFIAYSDIHHNIWNSFNEGDRRIKESLRVEKEIYKEAKKLQVPKLFIGDLLQNEKTVSNKLLSYILPHYAKLWGKNSSMTFAISGNHDQSEQNTPDYISPSYIRTLSEVFPGMICMDFKSNSYGNVMLHGIPYLTHDTGMLESLLKIKRSKDQKNILMIHTTLPGSVDTDGREMENLTLGKKTIRELKKFDLVLTGHIHMPMVLSKNIIQIGATNQQRKTDKGVKLGYWIIYSDMSYKFMPLKSAEFIELEWDEEKPDNKHYYYNKDKPQEKRKRNSSEQSTNFSKTENRELLADTYIKEKGIKDKDKKRALIKTLKDVE